MDTPILTLTLRSRRDTMLARRHARHIAGLLGFSPRLQAWIAAVAFEIACNCLRDTGRAQLHFRVFQGTLHVVPDSQKGAPNAAVSRADRVMRLDMPLPHGEENMAPHDVAWALKQVTRLAPLNLFEEMRKQNQELLHALLDLQQLLERGDRAGSEPRSPAAA